MESMIKTESITFKYDTEEKSLIVLKDINIEIEKGSFVAVLGENGSGKSTLAKHFNAIFVPNSGKVFVDGIDTQDDDKLLDIRQKAGMVFQNPDNQIVATVVEEDIAFALENLGVDPKEIRIRVDEALETVGMTEFAKHAPHQLSGGQKQRIAIAGVLAMKPECIILDEPTAMLDPRGRAEVMNTIKKLNKEEKTTVVLITHYMDEAIQADKIFVMNDGELILEGNPKSVFSNVEKIKAIGLDVPQATELVYKLKESGIKTPSDILTEQECINYLDSILPKGGQSVE